MTLPTHGLSPATVEAVASVLRRFPPVEEAILFGSRAKGVARPGSDIDLALVGPGLDWSLLGCVEGALDDTLLPYRFSLATLDSATDPDLRAHILRVGQPFYRRETARPAPPP